jgi:hypothetical protein
MADLLTHVAVANLCGKASRDDRVRAVFLVGTCVPDVVYKGALLAGGASTWAAEPSHSPLPLVALCYGAALLFEETFRARAFGALFLGACLHLLLDLGKDYMGQGVILWAFPFSMDRVELGLYHNEETVYFMAPSLALIVLTELAFRRRRG